MTRDDYASLTFTLAVLVLALVALTGCTTNQWRASFHAANAADAYTTIDGLNRGCIETMPLVGENPSNQSVVLIALGQSLLAELVCHHLAGDEEKVCWQMFTAVKFAGATWNASQQCH